MKKNELLRDVSAFGILWAAVIAAVFGLPDVPVSTKYLLAGFASMATLIGAAIYFGWDRIYNRKSLVKPTVVGVWAIGVLLYTGYLSDSLALTTWQWLSIYGVLVVTWANMFGLLLLLLSVMLYYWSFKIGNSMVNQWQQIRQEEAEKQALEAANKAAEQLLKLIKSAKE